MNIVVKQKQSIHDIATQYTGSSEHAIAILLANGKSNADLIVGELIKIPLNLLSDKSEAFYKSNGLDIGCSASLLDEENYNPEIPDGEVDVSVNDEEYKTVNIGTWNIPILNSEGDIVNVTPSTHNVYIPDIELNVYYGGVYQGTQNIPVGVTLNIDVSEIGIPELPAPIPAPLYSPGNVNIRVNSKYFKTVTSPASLNVPLKNSNGENVEIDIQDDDIILSDTQIKIFINSEEIEELSIPISQTETINFN